MRTGISAGAGAQLTAMLGNYVSGGIPEPSTILLVLMSAVPLTFSRRLRRQFA
jgi:hypothetical protein